MKYRQVNLDFHTGECVKNIGEKFSKEQFQEALKVGHIDSVTLFSKCHHGWSLSPAVYSIEANEIGDTQKAYSYFRSSAYMDLCDFKHNTAGGLHLACLGGVWMAVANGFFGYA